MCALDICKLYLKSKFEILFGSEQIPLNKFLGHPCSHFQESEKPKPLPHLPCPSPLPTPVGGLCMALWKQKSPALGRWQSYFCYMTRHRKNTVIPPHSSYRKSLIWCWERGWNVDICGYVFGYSWVFLLGAGGTDAVSLRGREPDTPAPQEEPWLHRAVNYTASLLGWGRGAGCSSPCLESPYCVLAGFS